MTESPETIFHTLVNRIRHEAYPIQGAKGDFDPLLRLIGDADFVLLGEATHGTHEFYHTRAEITKRLIQEKGFNIVAVEADWPDAYRINRYVRGRSPDSSAEEALEDFQRFPRWMWRNTVVRDFIEWLREYNQERSEQQVGFYGLDLYSLYSSIDAVLKYLDEEDPEAARRARYRYACFDHFGEDPQTYGYAASFDLTSTCEKEVVEQLQEMRHRSYELMVGQGFAGEDEHFYAEQNARIVKNAEEYYRSMFTGRVPSWNLRDRHMFQTLNELVEHHRKQGEKPKAILWEHNSHLGDARATDMSRRGELNVGQLTRERYHDRAVLVGYTTYTGSVTAASEWGGPAERKLIRPALPGSYESLFHHTGIPQFTLLLDTASESLSDLQQDRLQRAIGVIYLPQSERVSHYFYARLMDQFNAVIHLDVTRGVEPLDIGTEWAQRQENEEVEVPQTFPSAL